MKKEIRQMVYYKCNKRCAYCGSKILYKDFQIDHIIPESRHKGRGVNNLINLMPSCRRCNHYKRAYTLEEFREFMKTLHERLVERYINKVAIDYGIIEIKEFDGVFYFERD